MSRWLDLTSGYLLDLQAMDVTETRVRALTSGVQSVQAKLETM